MPLSLMNTDLSDIREGTRVQSFKDRGTGDVVKVDKSEEIVWIHWNTSGAVVPYVRDTLAEVFSVDNQPR